MCGVSKIWSSLCKGKMHLTLLTTHGKPFRYMVFHVKFPFALLTWWHKQQLIMNFPMSSESALLTDLRRQHTFLEYFDTGEASIRLGMQSQFRARRWRGMPIKEGLSINISYICEAHIYTTGGILEWISRRRDILLKTCVWDVVLVDGRRCNDDALSVGECFCLGFFSGMISNGFGCLYIYLFTNIRRKWVWECVYVCLCVFTNKKSSEMMYKWIRDSKRVCGSRWKVYCLLWLMKVIVKGWVCVWGST